MSDNTLQQLSPRKREQSVEPQRREPAPLRAYYHHVRSILGKRRSEDGELVSLAQTSTTLDPNHPMDVDSTDLIDMADTGNSKQISRDGGGNYDNGSSVLLSPHPETISSGRGIFSMDGTTDKLNKRWRPPVAAIFIHAGAGYHSTANESIHLEACSEAARASMKVLKEGRSAIEAVEAAIRVLEDKEITNAGYGSNLAIDGTVECDATLVDHFGRSGACGAVPNVKNPITLARLILESSNQPLSLRRVPPNLLVGEGARDFAQELGITLVPNEALVSRNARDRFIRWREDLRRAESKGTPTTPSSREETFTVHDPEARKEHTNAILTGTWNEGQPDSPASDSPWHSPLKPMSPKSTGPITPQALPTVSLQRSPLSFLGSSPPNPKRPRFVPVSGNNCTDDCTTSNPSASDRLSPLGPHEGRNDQGDSGTASEHSESTLDRITDTVGAIAIDQSGHIAAGSSSGGIGMKHRGRVGPAALVGIGTAVIPADAEDPGAVAVAAVTSGTGEHMATSMASQRCAERIYQGRIRGPWGRDVDEDDENVILNSFIFSDFLGHPGVRESSSTGAIGVMAVKKAPGGYYLYFAHNTDSFALASMGSSDREPSCVMSRVNEGGNGVAQGARKIRI
ncbi:nucleophile aminohydrolase [Xylariaceae sp. FL1651]|nr:nucleophile aminohydrolase [Xylariaceae sp. FL1651]